MIAVGFNLTIQSLSDDASKASVYDLRDATVDLIYDNSYYGRSCCLKLSILSGIFSLQDSCFVTS